MAVWDISSATSSLRSLLGDNVTDKFEFKSDVYPTPDGVTRRFFVGQTRLVADATEIYHDGSLVTVSDIDLERGAFTYPASGTPVMGLLQASFYYQWFTDAELVAFLTEASNMLDIESPSGDFSVGLRPTLMSWACYNAYMRKAAEFAETVTAAAAGYEFKRDQATPNWTSLAKIALDQGNAKLKLFVMNPLTVQNPALSFKTFSLGRYQPP
jgi:hypothetical protein